MRPGSGTSILASSGHVPCRRWLTGTPREGRDATGGDVASEYRAEEEGEGGACGARLGVPGGRGPCRGQRKDPWRAIGTAHKVRGGATGIPTRRCLPSARRAKV